jgi:hypothetical protein
VLLAHQQRDRLELRAHRGRHTAAVGGGLHVTDRAGEHRDDVVAITDATLGPRRGTASACPALAWSGHKFLL